MGKGTEKKVRLKTFSEIACKPKLEFFDQFLEELCRDIEHSFVVVRDNEIFQFWMINRIEIISDAQSKALTWLDERQHMLQEYPDGHGHTMSWTGFLRKTPNNDGYLNGRR